MTPNQNYHGNTAMIMGTISKIPSALLILLWIYTGLDKLIRWEDSRKAFHNQTFPAELAEVLAYAVPLTELLIVLLLLFSASRWWGYLSSILLLTVFITYVGLIWVGAFPRVPCNCAGILSTLGWAEHFWLNLGFIGVAVWGLSHRDRENVKDIHVKGLRFRGHHNATD